MAAKGDVTVVELTRPQQAVARRVAETKATVPELLLGAEALVERRRTDEVALDALLVHACARALREVPRANASYRDGRWELYSRINVGVAVVAQDALIVPTIFDADAKSVDEIGGELAALTERARSGEITAPELSGGTFTVSVSDALDATPVILTPQAAALSCGALHLAPRVEGTEVVPRPTVRLTLACDYRILYGPEASRFLAAVARELSSG